jgi:hypothetical protein
LRFGDKTYDREVSGLDLSCRTGAARRPLLLPPKTRSADEVGSYDTKKFA